VRVRSNDFNQHLVSSVAPPQILETLVMVLPTRCNFYKHGNLPSSSFKHTPSIRPSPLWKSKGVFSLYLTGSGLSLARKTLWAHTKNLHLGRILSCFL